MKCPKCGYQNKAGLLVCNLCGEPLPRTGADGAAPVINAAGLAVHTLIQGSTWASPRYGISLRRPNAPGWTLTTTQKEFRRKDAIVEIVHLGDRYTVSVLPYPWKLVPPGACMADFARAAGAEEDRKKGRMVMGRGAITVDDHPAVKMQETYLDENGKPTQEINVYLERAAGYLRLVAAHGGVEFDQNLPRFQEIVDSVKLDPAGDLPPAWTHQALGLSLARPPGAEGAAWGWIQDAEVLEQKGGGWLVEILHSAAGARVALRAIDPEVFDPKPATFPEALASLVGAWHDAAPDLTFLGSPRGVAAGAVTALAFDVTYTDAQRGPLRTRRIVAPHPSAVVEVVAEAAPDRWASVAPALEAILATLVVPAGGTGVRAPTPWNLPAWGVTLGVPDDLRWAPCTSNAFLTGEGSALEFRDLLQPAALIEFRTHKRLPGIDLGMTLGGWALRFERAGKHETDFRFETRDHIEIDGQPAIAMGRTWTTADGQPRTDRLVCFERKGAMCLVRGLSTPDDFPRVDDIVRKMLAATKLAATHHVKSVLDAEAPGAAAKPAPPAAAPPAAKPAAVRAASGRDPAPAAPANPIADAIARTMRLRKDTTGRKPPPAVGATSGRDNPAAPPPPPAVGATAGRDPAVPPATAPPPGPPSPASPPPPPAPSAAAPLTTETTIDRLEDALRQEPKNARASILLALRFMATQRYEAAADVLRQAVKRM